MDGLKTQLKTVFSAVVVLLIAFGIDISDEQKIALLAAFGAIVDPLLDYLARFYTKAPMKGFEQAQKNAGVL